MYMNDVRNKPRFCDMYLNFNIDESIFKIVEWKYKIVDAIDADRGLVGISMNFLDRFCTIRCCTVLQKFMNLQEFRLAALTCMYITLKVYGQLSVSAKVFAQIARDISPTQVTQYELVVLKALRFKISPPTAAMYLYQIFRLNHFIEREVQDYAIYLVELAMFDYSSIWSSHSAATLALCALCEAKALFKKVTNNLEENNQEIAEIVHNLSATHIMNVNATDFAAGSKILSEKYSSTCTSFCS